MKKKIIIILSIIVLIFSFYIIYYFYYTDDHEEIVLVDNLTNEITQNKKDESNLFKVDIKGAVVNPGVYEVSEGMIVDDLIKLAGGLKSTATTSNINLSRKLTDEMVIYIFTKSELKTTVQNVITNNTCTTQVIEVNNCLNESNDSKLININTAAKEELITIPGIGESKADAIIEYRNNNTFKTIEDIMNVSGIGESAFEKIKNYITV